MGCRETSHFCLSLSKPHAVKLLRIYPTNINSRFIDEAVAALNARQSIIIPTDSNYAFACKALSRQAIENLCRIKAIDPRKHLLSIICADTSMASEYARIDNRAFRYIKEYTPGVITFILPASSHLPKSFKERGTVGIRIPDNPIDIELCRAIGEPLMITTVPENDETLISNPDSVSLQYATAIPLMIDGGDTPGTETTIVDLTDSSAPVTIREGAVTFQP